LIPTAGYQHKVREEEHAQALVQTFRERVGERDFARAAEFKEWLAPHPKRNCIFSYLLRDLPPVAE
jgi:hypothetical protein